MLDLKSLVLTIYILCIVAIWGNTPLENNIGIVLADPIKVYTEYENKEVFNLLLPGSVFEIIGQISIGDDQLFHISYYTKDVLSKGWVIFENDKFMFKNHLIYFLDLHVEKSVLNKNIVLFWDVLSVDGEWICIEDQRTIFDEPITFNRENSTALHTGHYADSYYITQFLDVDDDGVYTILTNQTLSEFGGYIYYFQIIDQKTFIYWSNDSEKKVMRLSTDE